VMAWDRRRFLDPQQQLAGGTPALPGG
jgi:hypothetical protein